MNLRPSGYEPDELPGCSTPRHHVVLVVPACERLVLSTSRVSIWTAGCSTRLMFVSFAGHEEGLASFLVGPLHEGWILFVGVYALCLANGFLVLVLIQRAGFNAWRRPTLPTLER